MRNLFTRMKETISADLHQLPDHKEQNPITTFKPLFASMRQETEKQGSLLSDSTR